jgi:hypothetical protein
MVDWPLCDRRFRRLYIVLLCLYTYVAVPHTTTLLTIVTLQRELSGICSTQMSSLFIDMIT